MFRLSNYLHGDYSQIIDCIWKFTYTALNCPPKKVQPICELSLYEIMIVKPRSSHALKSRLILCINPATERVKLLLMQQPKFRKYAYTIASACEIWTNLTLKFDVAKHSLWNQRLTHRQQQFDSVQKFK